VKSIALNAGAMIQMRRMILVSDHVCSSKSGVDRAIRNTRLEGLERDA
jgi:hypothetical protein